MSDTIYRRGTAAGLRPEDAQYVTPAAEALATLLEPSQGHVITVAAVHKTLRKRSGLYVPFASLRRILKAAGVRLVPEPGTRETLIRDVRFTAEGPQ